VVLYDRGGILPNAKILIVDDSPSDTNILCLALSGLDEEVEVEVVTDGQRALEFIHAQKRVLHELRPCVIVLDLHLPRHDGIEILQVIRQEPVLNHIGVVVLTGSASPSERAELERLGAFYRHKPMTLSGFDELAADLIAICKGLPVVA
jgi:chemotaxis family two-component system response regulator Rcp1